MLRTTVGVVHCPCVGTRMSVPSLCEIKPFQKRIKYLEGEIEVLQTQIAWHKEAKEEYEKQIILQKQFIEDFGENADFKDLRSQLRRQKALHEAVSLYRTTIKEQNARVDSLTKENEKLREMMKQNANETIARARAFKFGLAPDVFRLVYMPSPKKGSWINEDPKDRCC